MSAQRYPTDFDGVVAGDPFLKPPGQVIAWNWTQQALAASPIPVLATFWNRADPARGASAS